MQYWCFSWFLVWFFGNNLPLIQWQSFSAGIRKLEQVWEECWVLSSHPNAMMGTNILPRSSSSLFSLQLLLLLHVFFYSFVVTKVEGNECRLVMEKNEWAAGCIPAVNFVVKCKSWVFFTLAIVYRFDSVSFFLSHGLKIYFLLLLWNSSGRLWRCSNVSSFHLNQQTKNLFRIWFLHASISNLSPLSHVVYIYFFILFLYIKEWFNSPFYWWER